MRDVLLAYEERLRRTCGRCRYWKPGLWYRQDVCIRRPCSFVTKADDYCSAWEPIEGPGDEEGER